MVFGMGFATNSHTIPALFGPGDLILSDALNHTSIVEGARSSKAKVVPFAHNDPEDLERTLHKMLNQGNVAKAKKGAKVDVFGDKKNPTEEDKAPDYKPWNKVVIIIEGIYSMEGEMCRLREMIEIKKKYDTYLYLDEAHSIGAIGRSGRGVCEYFDVDPSDVDIMMGTFTKSFGSFGGYIASNKGVIDHLRRTCASPLYSNGMAPPCAEQAGRALELIMGEDGSDRGIVKIKQLRQNSITFRTKLREMGCYVLGQEDSPVIPMMLHHPEKISAFSRLALERKAAVVVVGFPAVPLLQARVRFCIAASHTDEDIAYGLDVASEVSDLVGVKFNKDQKILPKYEPFYHADDELDVAPIFEKWSNAPLAPPTPEYVPFILAPGAADKADFVLSSYDFLGYKKDNRILQAAAQVIDDYGVGSCGPRGFYGTLDTHLDLEDKIADFMGTEAAIVYSYGPNTISSVIPAFAKPLDIIVCDEECHYGIQTGCKLSRAEVRYFKHNDLEDLQRVLQQVEREGGIECTKLTPSNRRRFLVVEGLYTSSGDLAPIRELVALKTSHCFRLILDDSMAFGVLGATGRGSTEHAGVPTAAVDILVASLETGAASAGGFCVGTQEVVSHQRLSGAGYCFSASMPPFLCVSGKEAVSLIESEPERRADLYDNTVAARRILSAISGVTVSGAEMSPIMHVRWEGATPHAYDDVAEAMLLEKSVAIAQARYCPREVNAPNASLRLCMSARYSTKETITAIEAIASSIKLHLPDSTPMRPTRIGSWSSLDGGDEKGEALACTSKWSPSHSKRPLKEKITGLTLPQASLSTALGKSDASPPLAVPFVSFILMMISATRAHLLHQTTWGTRTTLMIMKKLRNPILDTYFEFWAHAGSETTLVTILLLLTWNIDMKLGRSLALLYGLNVYVVSFLKNVFCLPRPMGNGTDYGWPSVLATTAVSCPFFFLQCNYGTVWVWDAESPWATASLYTGVLAISGSMCASRLYFCNCSPADVQAGCIIGAIILRVWNIICADVDTAVMEFTSWWHFGAVALALLFIHPVPNLVQINETYKFCISALGFLSGFLLGGAQPMDKPFGRAAIEPTYYVFAYRTLLGMAMLQSFAFTMEYCYPRIIEAMVKISVGKQIVVPMWVRKLLKVWGSFSTRHMAGFAASWAIPRILAAMEL